MHTYLWRRSGADPYERACNVVNKRPTPLYLIAKRATTLTLQCIYLSGEVCACGAFGCGGINWRICAVMGGRLPWNRITHITSDYSMQYATNYTYGCVMLCFVLSWLYYRSNGTHVQYLPIFFQGPISRMLFFHRHSNSMETSFCSHSSCNLVIAIIFCTWHDSCTEVVCAKCGSDVLSYNEVTLKLFFHRIWITMENSWWDGFGIASRTLGQGHDCPSCIVLMAYGVGKFEFRIVDPLRLCMVINCD